MTQPSLSLHDIQEAIRPAAVRTDPPRNEERVKIRINVRPPKTTLPGVRGRVRRGVQEVIAYRADLPRIEALVEEDEAAFDRCRQRCADDKTAWLAEQLRGTEPPLVPQRTVELERHYRSITDRPTNPEAYFTQEKRRSVKPLIGKVEIIAEGIEPERTPEQARFEAIIAKMEAQQTAIVESVAGAIGNAITDGIAKIVAAMERSGQHAPRK